MRRFATGTTLAAVLTVLLLLGCSSGSGGGGKDSNPPGPAVSGTGTAADPYVLPIGTGYAGTVGASGTVYLKFTTAAADDYTVSVTQTQEDLAWSAYSGADYATGALGTCDTVTGLAGDEICYLPALAAGTAYYVALTNPTATASTFTIAVTQGQAAGSVAVTPPAVAPTVVYFRGSTDGGVKYQLWRSDGTVAGTYLLKTINAAGNAFPLGMGGFFPFGGKTYFGADDGTNGTELWVTDGTEVGTTMLKDLSTGGYPNGRPGGFTAFGTKVAFSALYTPNANPTVWVTDGTEAGTVTVSVPPAHINPAYLTPAGSVLYFKGWAIDPVTFTTQQEELWKYDGTTAGAVADMNGTGHSSPEILGSLGGEVLFAAADTGIFGRNLFSYSGSGTPTLKDVTAGGGWDGNPRDGYVVGDAVFFSANASDTALNGDLMKYTGGTASIVKSINSVNAVIAPVGDVSGKLLFTAEDDTNGVELWVSDGTAAGTLALTSFLGTPAVHGVATLQGQTYVLLNESSTLQLWRTDGTAAGTTREFQSSTNLGSCEAGILGDTGSALLFYVSDPALTYLAQLWTTDGTQAGTVQLGNVTVTDCPQ